jgi:YrbI family 3-deoxy-D-manno-octulosonate 8-phosphate phosphatase
VITRRRSEIVERRADELGIVEVHQGATDKRAVREAVLARRGLPASDAAYVGDDVGDLPAMQLVGFPIAVSDAVPPVKRAAAYITRTAPGHGAIRELCDLILAAKRGDAAGKDAAPTTPPLPAKGAKSGRAATSVPGRGGRKGRATRRSLDS